VPLVDSRIVYQWGSEARVWISKRSLAGTQRCYRADENSLWIAAPIPDPHW